MSGTRLLSRKAPATRRQARPALLVVAHGERGGAGDDRFVHDAVRTLRSSPEYSSVHACFISKSPTLESVYSEISAGPVAIYPMFMSDGYFVKQAIPRSLGLGGAPGDGTARQVKVLTPIGLSPQLPRLIVEAAMKTAVAAGLSADDCRLLLVAHGSKHDQASRDATMAVARETGSKFAGVAVGFLEETPFVDEQLAKIEGPAIVVGLFVGKGMHGTEDLPYAIDKSGRDDIFLAPPLTHLSGFMDLIYKGLNE